MANSAGQGFSQGLLKLCASGAGLHLGLHSTAQICPSRASVGRKAVESKGSFSAMLVQALREEFWELHGQ